MTKTPGSRRLHHIGIAVRSIAESLPHWTDGLGLELVSTDDVPAQGVRVAVLMAGPTRVELIEPFGDDSPVAKHLEKRGPGVHHMAFEVEDCQAAIDGMAAAGSPMIDRTPKPGAHDCRVAFVHPRGMDGVLTELVEDPNHGEASHG
ncbi:MAG: methylmalonyl-CoA epimerase [Planctomycetes bacterium]|nr:methylmalonyl-CoA epimerase [Planctomycetota bacterium]